MLLSVASSRPRNVETAKVASLFPEYIQQNADTLVSFIERYYEHINSVGLPSNELANITSEKDIDRVSDKYLTQIQSLIAKNVPESEVLDKVSLYKIILQYYRTRGSEDSIFAFFKIFFNELITVFYPRDYIFELSNGSGAWSDIDYSLVKNSPTNPNKTQLTITSDFNIGPSGFGLNPQNVQLLYWDNNIWTYDGKITNTQFPYLEKIQDDFGNFRWKYTYLDLYVYSENDTEWPDEATWLPIQREIYYEAIENLEICQLQNSQSILLQSGEDLLLENSSIREIKNIEYDSGDKWDLLGNIIDGYEINGYLGNSVSLNDDATRMAVGTTYFGAENTGHSKVYELNPKTLLWTQLGQDLTDNLQNENISYDLQLSADGTRVAVTASESAVDGVNIGSDYGQTRIYQYLPENKRWKKIGQTIERFNANALSEILTQDDVNIIVEEDDPTKPKYQGTFVTQGIPDAGSYVNFFGAKMSFSGDGNTIAISYLYIPFSTTIVYRYNLKRRIWQRLGGLISSVQSEDSFGYSIDLNYDGTVLAIGAPKYDVVGGIDVGKVKIYKYYENNKSWKEYGNIITPGTGYSDVWCGFSVSLNYNGDTVAIGAIKGKTDEGISTGYTQIYKFSIIANDWQQLGQTIYGNSEGDYGGYRVALDASGLTCAISYKNEDRYDYNNGYAIDSGVIRVYKYRDIGIWSQQSNDIVGDFIYDYMGSTLSISSDGMTIATGSLGPNDPDGSARVFKLNVVKSVNYYSSLHIDAIPEFALAYGELINSYENYPENTLYTTISLDPIVWEKTDATRQWIKNDRRSFASDSYKLHDGYYWQKYSYDVKTSRPPEDWLDTYLKFVHPAGLQLFASFLLQVLSTQQWLDYINYEAKRPQQDFSWLLSQRAPRLGAHSPRYQPGWLTGNERTLNIFAEALRLNTQDRNLYNIIYHILHLYFENSNFRNKVVREEYQKWGKFLDAGELGAVCLDKTIAQANEEYAFNNECKFLNISSIVDILSDGRYLENGYPRDLQNGVSRLSESKAYENAYTIGSSLENGGEWQLENSGSLLLESSLSDTNS